jgi:hypothetical protein
MARRSYEGLPSYEAGIRHGRNEAIEIYNGIYKPTVLNMLALILESTEDETVLELTNDCYNYLLGTDFKAYKYGITF